MRYWRGIRLTTQQCAWKDDDEAAEDRMALETEARKLAALHNVPVSEVTEALQRAGGRDS